MGVVGPGISNCVGPRLQMQSTERRNRQVGEQPDPDLQYLESLTEGQPSLGFCEMCRCRIVKSPMRYDRFARPARMGLTCCLVANGEDKVEGPCCRGSEVDPAFATQTVGGKLHVRQEFEGERMNRALRTAAGAVAAKLVRAPVIDERLAHDAAAGIASANK